MSFFGEDTQDNRRQFEKRLKNLFSWKEKYSTEEIIEALIANDTQKISEIQTEMIANNQKIDSYLTQFDNATTDEEKIGVISSVTIGE